MYNDLVKRLHNATEDMNDGWAVALVMEAADAIEKLNKRIDFLMSCIYEAEDSLDRGADNDWARAALEKAERGHDDGTA